MTTEVVHSLAVELLPKRPGFAAAELPEREYVGQPHSAFHETEDEMRSRLSAQRIAQSCGLLDNRFESI